MSRPLALLILTFLVAGCATLVPLSDAVDGKIPSGTKVRIRGYISLAFEGQSIYQSRELCTAGDTSKALWVDLPLNQVPDDWTDCAFGEVLGTFSAKEQGHFGAWPSGGVAYVWRVVALRH